MRRGNPAGGRGDHVAVVTSLQEGNFVVLLKAGETQGTRSGPASG